MVTAAPARHATPAARLGRARMAAVNAFWFGNGAHWQPLFISLVPVSALLVVPKKDADLLIGRTTAAGGVFALLVPILAGFLSDRTRSRFGRRRPWMVAGTAVNVLGLALLGAATTPIFLMLSYLAVQASNNVAGAAYAGIIPDVVPEQQRGTASGMLGTMNALGTVAGVGGVYVLLTILGSTRGGAFAGYACVSVILVITLVITCASAREKPSHRSVQALTRADGGAPPRHQPRWGARVTAFPPTLPLTGVAAATVALFSATTIGVLVLLVAPLGGALLPLSLAIAATGAGAVLLALRIPALRRFFAAFRDHDFFWTFATRTLMQMGIFSIVPFMTLYFTDVVDTATPHARHNAGAESALWLLAVLGAGVVPALVGGHLSDRWGRRKLFVYASGIFQAGSATVLLFGLVSNSLLLYGLGMLFGVGYGIYYAVDWALACDVLPDRETAAGRDMALWHVALTLPQVLAPALLAGVLHRLNESGHHLLGLTTGNNLGYRVVFGSAAVWFALGTVMVHRIRKVR